MENDSDTRCLVDELAEDYLARLRDGQWPSVREYTDAHPEIADEIRDVFRTLAMLEDFAPNHRDDGSAVPLPTEAPQQVGDYRIVRELGRGGMGVVYEAEHGAMRRRVALKVLHARPASRGNDLQRFQREARAAGRLHHTNIVPVFEVGIDGETHFYAMQCIRGQNLDLVIADLKRLNHQETEIAADGSTLLPSGEDSAAACLLTGSFHKSEVSSVDEKEVHQSPDSATEVDWKQQGTVLPSSDSTSSELSNIGDEREGYFRRIGRIGVQVSEALAYAHEHGILHRDIKPANLILDTEGTVWVTDFGLARSEEDDLTNTGDIVGTLRYMAPERLKGHADARSDVYSLGLTLYELCTLRYAFDSLDRSDLIRQVNRPDILRPRAIAPAVPKDLETIVLKCLDHDPGARYGTAEELAEDLRRFVSDRPILARRVSFSEQMWRWGRRNPVLGGLVSAVCVLLTVVVVGAVLFAMDVQRRAVRLGEEKDRALAAERDARGANLESRRTLFDSLLNQARASRWSGRRGQRFETLAAVREADDLLETLEFEEAEVERQRYLLRNEAIAALPLVDLQRQRAWPAETRARCVVSTDGRRVASCDAQGLVSVFDGETGLPVTEVQGPDESGWRGVFSADSSMLAMLFHPASPAKNYRLRVWDLDSGDVLLAIDEGIDGCVMDFESTGDLLLMDHQKMLKRWNRKSGEIQDIQQLAGFPSHLLSAEDGRLIISIGSQIEVRTSTQSTKPEVLDFPGYVHRVATYGPFQLAAACGDDNAYIHDLQTGERRAYTGHLSNVTSVRFAAGGRLLLTGSWDERLHVYDIASGERRLQLEGYDLAQGKNVAENRIHLTRSMIEHGVWELAAGEAFDFIEVGDDSDLRDVASHPLCPDVIAVAGPDLTFWNTRTRQCLATFPRRAFDVEFTPDGRFAYVAGVGRDPCVRCELSLMTEAGATEITAVGEPQPLDWIQVSIASGRGQHIAIDRNGHRIALKNGSKEIVVYDVESESELSRFSGHTALSTLSISPDGDTIASGAWHGTGIRVWNVLTGDSRDLMPDSGNSWSKFSPDGEWLIVSSEAGCFRWDTSTWRRTELPDVRFDSRERPVAFSPCGTHVLLTSTRYVPRLVEVRSGKTIALLQSPVRGVGFSTFSSDGAKILTAVDGGVKVWAFRSIQSQLERPGTL